MSSVIIAGDISGAVTLEAPAVAGATVITLPSSNGTLQLANSALNGSLGATTPSTVVATTVSASSLIARGSTSGSVSLFAPTVAGSTTQSLVDVTGTLAPLVTGTAQATTSGTFKDFTGIPSWVKRITVMFSGVSTSGTSIPLIQLGDSGGFEITGYLGSAGIYDDGPTITTTVQTIGFGIDSSHNAAFVIHGAATISLFGSNQWIYSSSMANSSATNPGACFTGGGSKTLSTTLDRVRITTVNGTDTFDAGTINIMYE
jgi:hypothetical protein